MTPLYLFLSSIIGTTIVTIRQLGEKKLKSRIPSPLYTNRKEDVLHFYRLNQEDKKRNMQKM